MRLNIICEDSKIGAAREKAKALTGAEVLKTPLSETGKEPATHWFCSLTVNDVCYKKIMDLQEHSTIIENENPKRVLATWKLKVIK